MSLTGLTAPELWAKWYLKMLNKQIDDVSIAPIRFPKVLSKSPFTITHITKGTDWVLALYRGKAHSSQYIILIF